MLSGQFFRLCRCGRTGAGKSSITVAMLRLADEIGGKMFIDGLDTTSMALSELRGRLALIPQVSLSVCT